MRRKTARIIITILALFLLCGVASAASISDCTVTNSNVYADSNQYDIAPSGYYDGTTATYGISRVSGRYVYANSLSASPNPVAINGAVTFTVNGQQGASIIQETDKASSGYTFTYESGSTGSSFTHSYGTSGQKSPSLEISNPAGSTTISTNVNVVGVSIIDSSITNTNVYSGSNRYDIAPSGYYDSSTHTSGITQISGRYVYATSLTANPNSIALNGEVTFTLNGQQGAAITQGTDKAEYGYTFTYESGVTGNSFTHSYPSNGQKTPSLNVSNPAGSSTVSTTVDVSGVAVSDCTITNTNIHSSSNQYDIAPLGYYDSTTTTTGLTHVSGRYIYANDLTATPNPADINEQITFSLMNQQGAAIKQGTNKAENGYDFTYETGITGHNFTHTYTTGDRKPVTLVMTNPAGTITLNVNVDVGIVPIVDDIIKSQTDLQTWHDFYNYYKERTLTIGNDITVTNNVAIPEFAGTLNGNNHALINLRQPLINSLSGTIQNLKFKDCIITGADYAGLVSATTQTATIENVDAENCNIHSTNSGGITGAVLGQNTIIRNCNVNQCTVIGTAKSAGITPVTQADTVITNVHVTKSDITSPSGYAWGVSP